MIPLPQDIIARAGWIVKSFHTFFDYWNRTRLSMMKSGRAMYNWPLDDGGIPPTYKSIKDEVSRTKFHKFVECLLGHHDIPENMKYMLASNGVRFFSDFIQVMKDDPMNPNRELSEIKQQDQFTNNIYKALHFAGVTQEEFSKWQKDITQQFKIDNFSSHPSLFTDQDIKDIPLLGNWSFNEFMTVNEQRWKSIVEQNNKLLDTMMQMNERQMRMEGELLQTRKENYELRRMIGTLASTSTLPVDLEQTTVPELPNQGNTTSEVSRIFS